MNEGACSPPNGKEREDGQVMKTSVESSLQIDEQGSFLPAIRCVPISALKYQKVLQAVMEEDSGLEPDVAGDSMEVLQAQEEWEALENIQPGAGGGESPDRPGQLISFDEALQHFQRADLSICRKRVQSAVPRRRLSLLFRCIFGPPQLRHGLQEERELILAIAQWSNPATDLRGAGFLALLHLLYLVMNSKTLLLAHDIFRLSQHHIQYFPFCVMSINITQIVIRALREECLSKECNRQHTVIPVVNNLYAAAFLHLAYIWRTQQKTILDSSFVLKDLEVLAKKNPKQLLRSLDTYLTKGLSPMGLSGAQSVSGSHDTHPKNLSFTGVCDLQLDTMEGV